MFLQYINPLRFLIHPILPLFPILSDSGSRRKGQYLPQSSGFPSQFLESLSLWFDMLLYHPEMSSISFLKLSIFCPFSAFILHMTHSLKPSLVSAHPAHPIHSLSCIPVVYLLWHLLLLSVFSRTFYVDEGQHWFLTKQCIPHNLSTASSKAFSQ